MTTIGGKTYQQFVKANLPELVKKEGMTPQQAMKAIGKWWRHYKRIGFHNPKTKRSNYRIKKKIKSRK